MLLVALMSLTSCGEKENIAIITTDLGEIQIKLYDNTPGHRDNFIKLVEEGFYDDLLFHRVIPGFMCQGGDPKSKNAAKGQPLGAGGPGYTIPAEINDVNIHTKGALSAARRGQGNPTKASSGSQYYIVTGSPVSDDMLDALQNRGLFTYTEEQRSAYKASGGYPSLDGEYTVFGEVISGIEVAEAMTMQPRDQRNRPNGDIRMTVKMK